MRYVSYGEEFVESMCPIHQVLVFPATPESDARSEFTRAFSDTIVST